MNYTSTNEQQKLEKEQEEINYVSNNSNDEINTLSEDNSNPHLFQDISFSDLPSESPIAFDKSAILPLEELEVDYEWFDSNEELEQNTKQLNGSVNSITESKYVDEAAVLSQKSSLSDMKSKSNLFLGIVLSLAGALGAAYIWGKTTMIIDEYIEQYHYAFMAVLVGLLAALGMRVGGRGHRSIFGIVTVLIVILGCLIGNALAAVEPIVNSFQLTYIETFSNFNISHLWGFLKDRFEYVDIIFYALGLFFAYYFSFTKPKRFFS